MRAFFCVEIDDSLKQSLHQISRPLHKTAANVSWVKSENLHITLKFLGDIDSSLVGHLRQVSDEVVKLTQPFTYALDRLGAFPDERKPRVIWIGCSQLPTQLIELHSMLDSQLENMGFQRERHFEAHITLGRVKEDNKGRFEDLNERFQKIGNFQFQSTATGLTLMESQLTPHGPIYTPLFRLPFVAK